MTPRNTDPRYSTRPRGVSAPGKPTYPAEPAPEYPAKPAPEYPTDPAPQYPPEGQDPGPEQPPEGGYGPDDEKYPGGEPAPDPGTTEPPPRRCPPSMSCDTHGLDDLRCEAEAVRAEADELTKGATDLTTRQKAFETTRAAYAAAREAAAATVKEQSDRLEDLTNKIKCGLHADEVGCVDRAFEQVIDCVRECGGDSGCGIPEDCGFTGEQWTTGQIDDLRARVDKVEKYFDEVLVKEPDALKGRVDEAKKAVDDLAAALKAETGDPQRLYAQAKEARWRLDTIYGPFGDVNQFQDCLCRGLTCSLQGRKLIAELTGDKKYQDCQETARKDRCDWLRKNIVDETLAVVLQICPPQQSYPADGAAQPTTPCR